MQYLLAHDIGTSGDKATLFTIEGKAAASCFAGYPMYQVGPLYAEQDAEDWWRAFCTTTGTLIAKTGVRPEDILAVSFSGQMMGCLPVDDNDQPLRRAVIWADQRAVQEVDALRSQIGDERFYRITGHRNSPSYSIQKAMWIRNHEPDVYRRTRAFLNAKDWIVLKLTGRFVTDPSDANGTDAIHILSRSWSEEILEAAGIDVSKMPEIIPTTAIAGELRPQAAAACGLCTKTLVIMGAGDGVAANVGAGSVTIGSAYMCMGTSAWVSATSKSPVFDPKQRSVTWVHAVPGLYAPNATMQYCGGTYDWFRETIMTDELRRAEASGENVHDMIAALAETVPPGSNGLIFLPHLLGERAPRWNPHVRGAYAGLSGMTTRAEIVRSTFEGISYNLALCFDLINTAHDLPDVTLIGGCAKNLFWAQMIADMFEVPAVVPEETGDANSMGAAVIAGVGAGLFSDFKAAKGFVQERYRFEPRPAYSEVYREGKARFEACYQAMESLYEGKH